MTMRRTARQKQVVRAVLFAALGGLLIYYIGWRLPGTMLEHFQTEEGRFWGRIRETSRSIQMIEIYLDAIKENEGHYPISERIGPAAGVSFSLPTTYQDFSKRVLYSSDHYVRSADDFIDPFSPNRSSHLQYISPGKWFMIIGKGPDGEFSSAVLDDIYQRKELLTSETLQSLVLPVCYDPTNGFKSKGDIVYRCKEIGGSSFLAFSRQFHLRNTP